jgi:carbon monoxide dehydrogenase subunit G
MPVAMSVVERRIELDDAPERIWRLVNDIPVAAKLLPGLTLADPRDDACFAAGLTVPVGLVALRYTGTLALLAIDDVQRTSSFRFDGAAPGGRTAVVAIDVCVLAAGAAASRVNIATQVRLDAATTFLAAPMIPLVGGALLDGFGRNLRAALARSRTAAVEDPR